VEREGASVSGWRQELQDNPRLRAGLLAVAALLWLFGLFELDDRVRAAERERARLSDELARLRVAAAEQQWPALRDQVKQRLDDYRALAWREESEGRMQATLQDWLREQFAAVGLQPRDLQVSVLPASAGAAAPGGASASAPARKAELPTDLRIARARMAFDFQPDGLHRLLAALDASRRWIWVSRLSVDNGGRRSVELELEALFVLGAKAGS
jgi:hypothetical protein